MGIGYFLILWMQQSLWTLKKLKIRISSNLEDLIDDDLVVTLELSLLTSNIKREICGVLIGFLLFFKKYEENKAHNILSFMLDPRFKSLKLVSFLIGQKHIVSIMEAYYQSP